MSQQISIIAIATPAPGKLERFKEATAEAIEWIQKNEPGTLQFDMYEALEPNEDGKIQVTMFERYASKAALEKHENSEKYKNFFGKVMEEEMLEAPPQIVKGGAVAGFRR